MRIRLYSVLVAWMTLSIGAETSQTGRAMAESQGAVAENARVHLDQLPPLPAPVARFFRHVLSDGQPVYRMARLNQEGMGRMSTQSAQWMPFTAVQTLSGEQPGFAWGATIGAPPRGTPVRCTAISPRPSGAPPRSCPARDSAGRPIDDDRALATLTDHGTSVALEFRFNQAGEVVTVYSPGRRGSFDGGYKQVAREGHFRDHDEQDGMRIPGYAEAGWYNSPAWQVVWKATVRGADFSTGP